MIRTVAEVLTAATDSVTLMITLLMVAHTK
jgi:hypothetical protein